MSRTGKLNSFIRAIGLLASLFSICLGLDHFQTLSPFFVTPIGVWQTKIEQAPSIENSALGTNPSQAQTDKTQQVQPSILLEDRLRAIQSELKQAEQILNRSTEQDASKKDPVSIVATEVDLLKQIESLINQQQAEASRTGELNQQIAEKEQRLQRVQTSGPDTEETPTFLTLDRIRDNLESHLQREIVVEGRIQSAAQDIDRLRKLAVDSDKARLLSKEKMDRATTEEDKANAARQLRIAELQTQLTQEAAAHAVAFHENEKLTGILYELEEKILNAQIAWLRERVAFTQEDLNNRKFEIQQQEARIEDQLKTAEYWFNHYNQQLVSLKANSDSGSDDKLLSSAKVDTARAALQSIQHEIRYLNWARKWLAESRQIWNDRLQVSLHAIGHVELRELSEKRKEQIKELTRERRYLITTLDELRRIVAGLKEKTANAESESQQVVAEMEKQIRFHGDSIKSNETQLAMLDSQVQLLGKLVGELGVESDSRSPGQVLDSLWNRIGTAWSYVVFSVDDRPITVGKIVSGIVLLIAGIWLSRILSRWLGRRVLRRFGVHPSAAAAIQSLALYALTLTFALIALNYLNVPLTAFTFLGGAIAIGIGFGSQNILNNFISGLILLAERPVRVGDTIQLEGMMGVVDRIGARSTRVKTATNMEIIVPNSSFLENNVINWTLSDSTVRASVSVGVAYGSPTREVAKLLRKAAEEHGKILEEPAPFVWFTDFADSALTFELHFWLLMRNLGERRQVESDVRFRIDNLFRDAGIVIAFPQRDLHLASAKPLEVQIISQNDAIAKSHTVAD